MKQMKKILGIPMTLFVVGVLLIGGVSAALVGYLSNKVEVDVTVDSPMELSVSAMGTNYIKEPYSAGNILGGETLTFYAKTKNLASATILGNIANVVTNEDGLTCADFVSVVVTTTSTYEEVSDIQPRVIADPNCNPITPKVYECGPYDLIALNLCLTINTTAVRFSYGPTPIDWAKKQVDVNYIAATFKTDAFGTYVFTNQVVPVV